MKPLIVSMALVFMAVMVMSFNGDYMVYTDEAAGLKEAASECAAAAALSLDSAAYADGRLIFDRPRAVAAALSSFEYYLGKMNRVGYKDAYIILKGYDDSGIWGYEAALAGAASCPAHAGSAIPDAAGTPYSITACLYIRTDDVFKLSGIEVTEICRISTYELKTSQI